MNSMVKKLVMTRFFGASDSSVICSSCHFKDIWTTDVLLLQITFESNKTFHWNFFVKFLNLVYANKRSSSRTFNYKEDSSEAWQIWNFFSNNIRWNKGYNQACPLYSWCCWSCSTSWTLSSDQRRYWSSYLILCLSLRPRDEYTVLNVTGRRYRSRRGALHDLDELLWNSKICRTTRKKVNTWFGLKVVIFLHDNII